MRCAFGAHLDVGVAEQLDDEPRADSLEISRFLPSFLGKMAVFDKMEPLEELINDVRPNKLSRTVADLG